MKYSRIFKYLITEPKLITSNNAATIRDLEACSKYMFAVGFRDPKYGAGPLSEPYKVDTHFNPRARPKQLRVTQTDKADTIVVSWKASCQIAANPMNYTVC